MWLSSLSRRASSSSSRPSRARCATCSTSARVSAGIAPMIAMGRVGRCALRSRPRPAWIESPRRASQPGDTVSSRSRIRSPLRGGVINRRKDLRWSGPRCAAVALAVRARLPGTVRHGRLRLAVTRIRPSVVAAALPTSTTLSAAQTTVVAGDPVAADCLGQPRTRRRRGVVHELAVRVPRHRRDRPGHGHGRDQGDARTRHALDHRHVRRGRAISTESRRALPSRSSPPWVRRPGPPTSTTLIARDAGRRRGRPRASCAPRSRRRRTTAESSSWKAIACSARPRSTRRPARPCSRSPRWPPARTRSSRSTPGRRPSPVRRAPRRRSRSRPTPPSSATGVSVSHATIYPVTDGIGDTVNIRGRTEERTSITIAIVNSAGKRVRSIGLGTGSAPYSTTWDGRTSSGTIVPAGRYTVMQTLVDLRQNRLVVSSPLVVSHKRLVDVSGEITRNALDFDNEGSEGFGLRLRERVERQRPRLGQRLAGLGVRLVHVPRSRVGPLHEHPVRGPRRGTGRADGRRARTARRER